MLALGALSAPGGAAHAAAAEGARPAVDADVAMEFDAGMLSGASRRNFDLSRFEKGVEVLPGVYNVDVYLNKQWVGRLDVRFAAPGPDADALPCLDPELVKRLQLQAHIVDTGPLRTDACRQLDKVLADARMDFDLPGLRLDASVPQAILGQKPRGYVDPEAWDAGVPAFLLNYRFNAYHSTSQGLDRTSAYLGLDAGFNLGMWHFRQNSTATWSRGGRVSGGRKWHTINAYVQRAIPSMKARLTLGDGYTDGAVFNSFALRGVQMATDDRMYPPSRRGYAPVVRGTAETNAKVSVRQNGVQIYQTTVPPGPFVIDDLYPTGYGGSLEVTVTEADGRQHTHEVPYASVAQLVRPGVTRFNVAAGQLRNMPFGSDPRAVQGTIQHGFNNRFTGYAGFQGSPGYVAALVGGAVNTRFGALALDFTHARASLAGQDVRTGRSMRVTWSKMLPDTRTAISVAAYRYSTRGFLDLGSAARARAYTKHGLDAFQSPRGSWVDDPADQTWPTRSRGISRGDRQAVGTASYRPYSLLRQRNRFTLSLNQPLGADNGSLYANASFHDYWDGGHRDTLFQVGYSNHVRRLGYSVSASRSRDLFERPDNRVYLTFSLPLGDAPRSPNLMVHVDRGSRGRNQDQAMVNGSLGRRNEFNWGASVSRAPDGAGNAASVNAGYRGPNVLLNASYGKGSDYSQAALGMSGALLAHSGGVTFGQPTGDTVALVHASGAAGAKVQSAPGVTVDSSGYALVPYLAPYQLGTIRIDTAGMPLGVQLEATSLQVAPYAGAVVMADFKTRYGRALVARIALADGQPIPFAAQVFDSHGNSLGVVGQGGLALLRGVASTGRLHVEWQGRQGVPQACAFAYTLPDPEKGARDLQQMQFTCDAQFIDGPSPNDVP